MTPERRKALAGFLRALASQTHPLDYQAEFRDAADALEADAALRADLRNKEASLRNVSADLDVARADLAKAKERIAELEGAASLLLGAAVVQSDGAFVAPQAFAPAVRAAWLALADARKTEP